MLKITATDHTPLIDFNIELGVLRVEGKSIAENAFDFYQPLFEALAEYKKNPQPQTTVHLKLIFFNTASSKSILDILCELESLKSQSEVTILWYHEKTDEDMLEAGEDYSEIIALPFLMVEVDEQQ